jgi:hypothetical protein
MIPSADALHAITVGVLRCRYLVVLLFALFAVNASAQTTSV